ncbi:hypothetical protein [Acetobacter sp.]|uniref:hypothetical protein n=1 Tax=Acetobacter sp. TaxID=440 RepID=UPI0039E9E57C
MSALLLFAGPSLALRARQSRRSERHCEEGGAAEAEAVEGIDRIPELSSNRPWKAMIGLAKDDIPLSDTVWKRTIFQTELIIVEGLVAGAYILDETR